MHNMCKYFYPKIGVCMERPSALYKLSAKLKSIIGYGWLKLCNIGSFFPFTFGFFMSKEEKEINKELVGYPSNHTYKIWKNIIFPKFQLYERLRLISPLYPKNFESILDIGSCKGFFTLNAAQKKTCKVATGIDVYEPFLEKSTRVKNCLKMDHVTFHKATLDKVAEDPEKYGGPFQTVLLTGTYHYLFWGSELDDYCFGSHEEILKKIHSICTDRLIFSARLEIERCPKYIRDKATKSELAQLYTTEQFLKAAHNFFDVERTGFLSKYPLFLMRKK